jgi:5'-nucleotidase
VIPIPRSRLRSLLVGTVGAALIATPLAVATPAVAAPPPETTIALLNFNDFHGRIDSNTTKFATTIEAERATYGDANTLLLSAGDSIGASLFASATDADQPTIDVLNALDLKASAVGNHEFDRGWADLRDRVINGGTNATWDYLGANVYNKGTTTPALPEYSLQTVGGFTIGVVGVVTQETASLVSPAGISTLSIGDEVDAVNRVADQLKDGNPANGEADIVVAEIHDGASVSTPKTLDEAKAASASFTDIVDNTSANVSVIFNGHTHMTYAWTDPNHSNRPIVQAASYGTNLGKVVLTVDNTSKAITSATGSVLTRAGAENLTYSRVAAVKTIVDAALAHAAVVGNAVSYTHLTLPTN